MSKKESLKSVMEMMMSLVDESTTPVIDSRVSPDPIIPSEGGDYAEGIVNLLKNEGLPADMRIDLEKKLTHINKTRTLGAFQNPDRIIDIMEKAEKLDSSRVLDKKINSLQRSNGMLRQSLDEAFESKLAQDKNMEVENDEPFGEFNSHLERHAKIMENSDLVPTYDSMKEFRGDYSTIANKCNWNKNQINHPRLSGKQSKRDFNTILARAMDTIKGKQTEPNVDRLKNMLSGAKETINKINGQ